MIKYSFCVSCWSLCYIPCHMSVEKHYRFVRKEDVSFLPKVDRQLSSVLTLVSHLASKGFSQSVVNTDNRKMKFPHLGLRWLLRWASLPIQSQLLPSPRDPAVHWNLLVLPNLSRWLPPPWMFICSLLLPWLFGRHPAHLLMGTPAPSSPPPWYLSDQSTFHRILCWGRQLFFGLQFHPIHIFKTSLFSFHQPQSLLSTSSAAVTARVVGITDTVPSLLGLIF